MKSSETKRKSGLVRVLGGFTETQNIAKYNSILQVDEFDDTSRIQLSNEIYRLLSIVLGNKVGYYFGPNLNYNLSYALCKDMLNDVFCERTSTSRAIQNDWHIFLRKSTRRLCKRHIMKS